MDTIIGLIAGLAVGGTLAGTLFVLLKKKLSHSLKAKTDVESELSRIKESQVSDGKQLEFANEKANKIISEAEQKSRDFERSARERVVELEKKVNETEKRLIDKENLLNNRISSVEDKEDKLSQKYELLRKNEEEIQKIRTELSHKLEDISGLTKEQAKELLLKELDIQLANEKAIKVKKAVDLIQQEADDEARMILVDTMDQAHVDYVTETTTKSLEIESDEIKGRIIGRDGRNIKTFEKLTGCEVIVDEAPNIITISGFDPLRREVAYNALNALIKDGRIHPGRIEEFIQKAKNDLAKEIRKAGEDISAMAGLSDLPLELIRVLGRFKYRYSYGQNQARHILEVSKISGYIADMIGLDVKGVRMAKKAGLLHDLGKVATESENPNALGHPEAGVILGKKFGIEEEIMNCMMSHHYLAPEKTLFDWIIRTADGLSGGRPGARNASVENYTRRVQALEEIAKKYPGVKESYAIYAGREVRVFVDPGECNDAQAAVLARDIAKEIEDTQTYPGTVQITVIREQRISDMAKATTVKDLNLPQMARNSE